MSGLCLLAATLSAAILFALVPRPAQAAALQPPRAEEPAACATIPELQGSGNTSPCQGHRADIAGCITGVTATGFFFQDLAGDGDPATSDGIYAFYSSSWTNPDSLKPGDRVTVSGTVTEDSGTTEFAHRAADPLQVTVTGACELPPPVDIQPYLDPWADPHTLYEHTESMRVHMVFIGWVVGPTKRFSSRYPAGDPEIALVDDRSLIPSRSRVFERDYPGYGGITYLNGGLGYDVRDLYFGDSIVGNVTGVLAYQYGKYTLLFDSPQPIVWESQPIVRPAVPLLDPSRGEFDICYFNAGNLFDHLNDGQGDWGDWAPGWPNAGTDTGEGGYRYKLRRIADVITTWLGGCALVGLEEVEGKQQVWDDLAAEVTERAHSPYGQRTWVGRYVESGDPRDISQGFLIRDDVSLLGGALSSVQGQPYAGWTADGVLDFVRTPAAGRFRFNAGRPEQVDVWAYNAHFKSKAYSASCATGDCVDVREREAADLRDILLHHRSLGEYAIAGGDLNDTHGSSPIAILDGEPGPDGSLLAGLWYEKPARERYSYIFNGESQALDHIYVTNLPVGTQPWKRHLYPMHVETDLPAREQASDHDPLRVVFWLRAEGPARAFLPLISQSYPVPPTPTRRPPATNTPTEPSPTTTISGCPTGPAPTCSACP